MTDTEDITTPVPGAEINAEPLSGESGTGVPDEHENGSEGSESKSKSPSREAAAYRVKLREAEGQRDALAERVEALQLRELEHYAGQHLADPKDLLTLGGVTLKDLLDADGYVDPDKVRVAAADVVSTRPGLSTRPPAFDPSQGFGGTPQTQREPTMADLFRGGTSQPY